MAKSNKGRGRQEYELVFEHELHNEESSEDDDESDSEADSGEGKKAKEKELKHLHTEHSSNVQTYLKNLSAVFEYTLKTKTKEMAFALGDELQFPSNLAIKLNKTGDVVQFPIYESQGAQLVTKFDQAPFGLGTQTLVDKTVRNSWQLAPRDFTVMNQKWTSFVQDVILPKVSQGLQLESPITASLYKILLYGPGSFFKPHRDTEKEPGMFGTLVVQLPSSFTGGELVIKHSSTKLTFDYGIGCAPDSEFTTFFTAFYCDCEHEILPLKTGYRACLVYNLISSDLESVPTIGNPEEAEKGLANILKVWPKQKPTILAYYLAHKYTKTLSLKSLKTTDRIVARLLQNMAPTFKLKMYLAQFSIVCKGAADDTSGDYDLCEDRGYMGPTRRGKHGIEPAVNICFHPDIDEIEKEITLSNIVGLDGKKFPHTFSKKYCNPNEPAGYSYFGMRGLGRLMKDKSDSSFEIGDNENIGVVPFNTLLKDLPEMSLSPTGNEGVEMEKWYTGAAIVFWREADDAMALKVLGVADPIAAGAEKPQTAGKKNVTNAAASTSTAKQNLISEPKLKPQAGTSGQKIGDKVNTGAGEVVEEMDTTSAPNWVRFV